MAAAAGDLETLGGSHVKLLPCAGRWVIDGGSLAAAEPIHKMRTNSVIFGELPASSLVYPGVNRRYFDAIGAYANVE